MGQVRTSDSELRVTALFHLFFSCLPYELFSLLVNCHNSSAPQVPIEELQFTLDNNSNNYNYDNNSNNYNYNNNNSNNYNNNNNNGKNNNNNST